MASAPLVVRRRIPRPREPVILPGHEEAAKEPFRWERLASRLEIAAFAGLVGCMLLGALLLEQFRPFLLSIAGAVCLGAVRVLLVRAFPSTESGSPMPFSKTRKLFRGRH
jgi:hypothetical protein